MIRKQWVIHFLDLFMWGFFGGVLGATVAAATR